MGLVRPLRGFMPEIGEGCFLAETSVVLGDVVMGKDCSVWYNAVLRGDVNSIRIGDRVNIQDGSVLHTLYQKSTIEIGNDVSIGHNVVIHGAKIHDYALIGMGAIVMDDAEVGEGALVAAGSVVLSRTKIGAHELWAGTPAKFVKMVEPEKAKEMNVKIAKNYLMYSKWYYEPNGGIKE
ncbi:MAG: gamma carbonic anhydrase family protein [Muribaculaceae bacterium]|nr:gamma carbonic anhydrase family protein [Muribaculaceae bacterium]